MWCKKTKKKKQNKNLCPPARFTREREVKRWLREISLRMDLNTANITRIFALWKHRTGPPRASRYSDVRSIRSDIHENTIRDKIAETNELTKLRACFSSKADLKNLNPVKTSFFKKEIYFRYTVLEKGKKEKGEKTCLRQFSVPRQRENRLSTRNFAKDISSRRFA